MENTLEINIASYNVACLEQLRRELARQMKKYPRQTAWIEIELARAREVMENGK